MQVLTGSLTPFQAPSESPPWLVNHRGDRLLVSFTSGAPSVADYPEILGPDGESWLLTVDQVALRLNLSRSRVYELLNQGMPSITLGRSRRIPVAALRQWLLEQGGEVHAAR